MVSSKSTSPLYPVELKNWLEKSVFFVAHWLSMGSPLVVVCLGLTGSVQRLPAMWVPSSPPGTVLCCGGPFGLQPRPPIWLHLATGSPLCPGLGRGWLWTCVGWSNLAFTTTTWENGLSGTQAQAATEPGFIPCGQWCWARGISILSPRGLNWMLDHRPLHKGYFNRLMS